LISRYSGGVPVDPVHERPAVPGVARVTYQFKVPPASGGSRMASGSVWLVVIPAAEYHRPPGETLSCSGKAGQWSVEA
jgi:hypothetical protein